MNDDAVPPEVVAIGASKGGLAALTGLLGCLPSWFRTPMLVVQHRRPDNGSRLVELLQDATHLVVEEPEDSAPIREGHLYLAPAGYHLLAGNGVLALSLDAPVGFARPSVDVLFESVAAAYRQHGIGVVLTSSSDDGARGARAIKDAGGRVMVQEPTSAESPEGPRAALAALVPDVVASVSGIAQALALHVSR